MCMHQGNEGVNYFVGKGLLNYCHGMLACMQWLPGSLIVSPRLPPKKDIIVVIIMHACIIIILLCHLLLFTRACNTPFYTCETRILGSRNSFKFCHKTSCKIFSPYYSLMGLQILPSILFDAFCLYNCSNLCH